MKTLDLSLYLVTKTEEPSREGFFNVILEAVRGGVSAVQLREKDISTQEFVDLASDLKKNLISLNVPLIINDRVDIAKIVNADGVHLGQSDATVSEARAILGPKAIIGFSVETMDQVHEAQSMDVDYIAVSPVFESITKIDTKMPWGLGGLRRVSQISRHPVVAIGGINLSNTQDVLNSGADGIAIVSAIFDAPSPYVAAKKFCQIINQRKSYENCTTR